METLNNDINLAEEYEINSWDDLDINPDLLRGIYSSGFEKPSPIQRKSIIHIFNGKDVVAQAQSGTGKTAAFSIGAIQKTDTKHNKTQVLILSPTRELTSQTNNVIKNLGEFVENLRIQTLVGGSMQKETNSFLNKSVPHIVCGCPGRVYDMLTRNKFSAMYIKLVILDEADEMLSNTFKEQVYNIFQYLNNDVQVALFSATLPTHIFNIIDKIMRDPVKINVKSEQLTLDGISQFHVAVDDDRQKYETLKQVFSFISLTQCIIYCNSVKRVTDLYDAMVEDNFPVCCIHSNMDKTLRDKSFNDFKAGKSRVLISSNVTSRGIDIQQVNVVINFDLPKCIHNYLHRIGRSGRWGRKGVAINFITRRDVNKIKEIETHYACEIKELPEDMSILKLG
jgi:superfamily II DNA/RNA helicase